MRLSTRHLKSLAEIACLCAEQAGQMLEDLSTKKEIRPKLKRAGSSLASSLVTEADIMSQDIILKSLDASRREFGLGLLAEELEADQSRLTQDYFWCVDPLDGTLPYTEGKAGYSVAISLISRSGEAQIGVIYDPKSKVVYHAIKGQGAFRADRILSLPTNTPPSKVFTLITDRSFHTHPHYEAVMRSLKELAHLYGFDEIKVLCQGGAAMNALWVIEHAPAGYLKLPKPQNGGGCIWDFAASQCIFKEMGLWVTDALGAELHLNHPETIYFNKAGIFYCSHKPLAESFLKCIEKYT